MSKKVWVTGATGFVGGNLVESLLNAGWDVSILVRPSSDVSQLSFIKNVNVQEYNGSIEYLIESMEKDKPDIVFHVASLFLSTHSPNQVDELVGSNILLGSHLVEAMSEAKVSYLVNTSTSWEHYESKDYSPVNLYAATKKAFQDILQFYVEARGIKAITLKLFDTYGSNDPRPKLLNLLFKIAETGETLKMSPGEQKIDLVHIDDVVSAYIVAAQRLLDNKVDGHETYGVSTGKPISIKELVKVVEQVTSKKLHIEWGGRPYRDREVMETWQVSNANNIYQGSMIDIQQGLLAMNKLIQEEKTNDRV